MNLNAKRGISLIALVITIIVIVILAAAVILTLANNNPIGQATKAAFLSDTKTFEDELSIYHTSQYANNAGAYNPTSLQADKSSVTYNGTIDTTKNINDIITALNQNKQYDDLFQIINGKLVFLGYDLNEQKWVKELGVDTIVSNNPVFTLFPKSETVVKSGTDMIYTLEITSGTKITNIDLSSKLQLLDSSGNAVATQPTFNIGPLSGVDTDLTRQLDITIKTDTLVEGEYSLKVLQGAITNSNNFSNDTDVTASNGFTVDNTVPQNPVMSADVTSWTNGNVTVAITYSNDSVTKQYSFDTVTWNNYTTPVVVTDNNTTVYARGLDVAGNQSGVATFTVANIDKESPTVTATNGGITTSSVTVTASATDVGNSGINASSYEYSNDNGATWTAATSDTSYTFTALTTGAYNCKVKVADNAGNIGISDAVTMTTTGLGTISMSQTPTTWTNGNVTVTITYPPEVVTKQYSFDAVTWNNYTTPVVVTSNNTTVYAKGLDAGGNQTAQTTLTVTNIYTSVPSITNAVAGSSIYGDPKFQSGMNSTTIYNNLGNGNVLNTRISMSDSPTGSGYGLEVKTIGTASPGWGGFYFATPSSANKVFISKIIAKIPVGYNINWSTNQIGGGTCTWLTDQSGTGNWQEYVCQVTCGPSGTFSTTNFYYLTGGTTPTASTPLVWDVAYANVYDTGIWGSSSNVMVSATDASGIIGYGINQSSTTAPTFTSSNASTKFATVFNNINSNGTYYVWVKDQAGNIAKSAVNVSYIDAVAPTVSYQITGPFNANVASATVTVNDAGGSAVNTGSLQYVWDTQNSTAPSTGWGSFTNGSTISKTTGIGTFYLWIQGADNAGNKVVNVSSAITVTDGLVARLSFNNSLLNSVNGSTYTGTGYTYVTGKVGTGLQIQAGKATIPLSDLGIDSTTNTISVAFWFKWNGENSIMPVGFYFYDVWINGGYFGFNTAQGDIYGIVNPFTAGTFTHVVAIFNKGNYTLNTLYINGVKQTLTQELGAQGAGNTTFTPNLYISGWGGDNLYEYSGSVIDELKVYNRALTDAEISQVMNN